MKPHNGGLDVGIVATDLAPMERFYTEVLGLEKVADRQPSWGPMIELAFGSSIVRISQADGAERQTRFGVETATGIRYVTFDVDDFDEMVARCRDADAEFALEVEQIRDLRIAMVKDPEGNIVEFIGH